MRSVEPVCDRVVQTRRRWHHRARAATLGIVLATVATALVVVSTASPSGATPTPCSGLEVLAHRGYHQGGIAENTLASFNAAAARGYSIETDVRTDAEGQMWIFHDRDPFRATGVHGFIDQMTTAQVSALRYKKGSQPLATFEQGVAAWQGYPAAIRVFVEPKTQGTAANALQQVQAAGLGARIIWTGQTTFVRNTDSTAKLMARSYQSVPAPSTLVAQGFTDVAFGTNLVTAQDVTNYHAAGLKVQLRNDQLTINWREAIRVGFDTLLTDYPDQLKSFCPVALNPPSISGFSPGSGTPGTAVTISGSDLTDASRVTFGSVAATFTVVSPTQITTTVPSNVSGSVPIRVTTPNGVVASPSNFTIAVQINSLTPSVGQPGDAVTITGSGFLSSDRVKFGSVDASFTVDSDTQITAVVPTGAPASAKILVHTTAGNLLSPQLFKVPPTLSSFSPGSGPVGSQVTITGTSLTAATNVKFGGVAASFSVDSDTQITATVPATAPASSALSVVTPGGTASSSASFVVPAPIISSFSPTGGPAGTVVVMAGSGFAGANSVKFGSVVASFTIDSDNQITVTVPSGAPASSAIRVGSPHGSVVSSTPYAVG